MSAQPGSLSWPEKAERIGRAAENLSLALLLAAMLFVAGAQILLRNLGEGGFPWADEALRIMVLWLAMLGGLAASREDRHISIDALARILPPAAQNAVGALIAALTAVICLLIAWHAALFVGDSREFGDKLLGELPAWWFQVILPFAFGLMGYRYLVLSLRRLRTLFARPPST
ncbi:MAG: TRAP transporter small permease [Gammaproteobacteria bacterium]